MSEELKPCPFCGGEGLPHRVEPMPKLYRITCKNCDAGPSACFDSYQAIAAWNTRPTEAAAEARGMAEWERLRLALEDIQSEMAFPNSLESGFVHRGPTLADMQKRVELAKLIATAALNGGQHE